MNQLLGENECEILTLTTTITGSKGSQKGVNSQVDYQNHNALGPRSLSFTGSRTQLMSSATHTQQSISSSEIA